MSNIKLAFLSSLKGHLYFARALQLGNLKVYGKLLKGHQGQDQGNGGICLHVTQAMINTAYIICSNKVIIVESLCPHLMSRLTLFLSLGGKCLGMEYSFHTILKHPLLRTIRSLVQFVLV